MRRRIVEVMGIRSDHRTCHDGATRLQAAVVGEDGTPASRGALTWAFRNVVADVHVVRAVSPAFELLEASFQVDAGTTIDRAATGIDAAVLDAGRRRAEVHPHVVEDSVPNALIDTAHRFGAPVIVVGSNGDERFGHLVGADIGRLLHMSDVPVVIVPDGLDAAGDGATAPAGEIVVGMSGDRRSDARLIEWVVSIATDPSRVRLVQVFPPSLLALIPGSMPARTLEEHALVYLSDLAPDRSPDALSVVFDEPLVGLAEASTSASLVVVGSHRSSRMSGYLMGSIAQHLPTMASCAVAVVPLPGAPRSAS